jgi:RNA polymerase sigma factor for flagellar operon FliA
MIKPPDPSRPSASRLADDSAKKSLPGTTGEYKQQPGAPSGFQGDHLTRQQEQVVLDHLPIVRFIARRIHERLPRHVPIEDLYSAGVVGLLDALAKFESSKQIKFRTYAQYRIRGAILDSLRSLDWSPRKLRRQARAVEEAIQILTAQLGRSPTEIEIAQQLQIDLEAYQHLLGELKSLEVGTLHTERSPDAGDGEWIYLPNRPEDDPLFRFLDAELRERLTKAITELPERERLVMTLYYYEETTMKEIGLILGIVESRVSQIHASAVLHLRALLAGPSPIKEIRPDTGSKHFRSQ